MTDRHKLMFVLGAPKSGTTWLQTILNHHPEVLCRGEGFFHHFGRNLSRTTQDYNSALAGKAKIFSEAAFPALTREEFRAIFRTFVLERLRLAAQSEGGKDPAWVGEKDPDHATYPDLMMETFPEATFIHIIRDGRDHAVSLWHHVQNYSTPDVVQKFKGFNDSALQTARNWAKLIRKVRETSVRTGVDYYELRYEDLIDRPAETAGALLEFLGVSRDAAVIQQCLARSDFRTVSGGRVPGQEDTSSFFRKGVKGDWRNHMDEEQARAFIRETGGLMEEMGYA